MKQQQVIQKKQEIRQKTAQHTRKSQVPDQIQDHPYLQAQGIIGNHGVLRRHSGIIQAKLTVGSPGDKYEQEADRVAEQVMRMSEPGLQRQPEEEEAEELIQTRPIAGQITPLIQRQEENEEEEEELIQPKTVSGRTHEVTPDVRAQINTMKDGGHPLPKNTRVFFEQRFGYNFSGVRIHRDNRAAEASKALNAQAFTVGQSVVFGSGQYAPKTSSGQRLLAHELTHIVQQNKRNLKGYFSGNQGSSDTTQTDICHTPELLPKTSVFLQQRPRGRPRRRRRKPPRCGERVIRARSFRQYVSLVRRAEERLIKCRFKDPSTRIKILSEIYYGTSWSVDYDVEKSAARNLGFQIYTRRPYSWPRQGPDPRPCLGCGLFLSLKRSQDVSGVDMGHVLIGLNARVSSIARTETVPLHGIPRLGPTGLDMVTWVGDLGGAAARVALDRVRNPKAGVGRYFRGTDYGASSNLEADVSAYVVASGTSTSTTLTKMILPTSGRIADALNAHFVVRGGRRNRCWQFLIMQGGRFRGKALQNRSTVEATMGYNKLKPFGLMYMINYLRDKKRFNWSLVQKARRHLPKAGLDVARRFVSWLLARLPRSIPKS